MGISMLGGSRATATTVVSARICDDALRLFESDDLSEQAQAVALCEDCPLLAACRTSCRADIQRGLGPAGVVRAAVAWTEDGLPDTTVHGPGFAPGWLPGSLHDNRIRDDLDPIAVALAFSEPDRVRETLTASERDAVYVEAARRGESLNFLRKTLKEHPRDVSKAAVRLGIRDAFPTKPRKKKPAVTELALAADRLIVASEQNPSIDHDAVAAAAASQDAAAMGQQIALFDIVEDAESAVIAAAEDVVRESASEVRMLVSAIRSRRESLSRRAVAGRLPSALGEAGDSLALLTCMSGAGSRSGAARGASRRRVSTGPRSAGRWQTRPMSRRGPDNPHQLALALVPGHRLGSSAAERDRVGAQVSGLSEYGP